MTYLANKETKLILNRLNKLIKQSEDSMRIICGKTHSLDVPERIHHSTLSNILNFYEGKNLYLQQFLVLLKLLDSSPEEFFAGINKKNRVILDAISTLDDPEIDIVINQLIKILENKPRTTTIRKRLERLTR